MLLYDCKAVNAICSHKVVKYLGNISFGIYMWNFPILITLHILVIIEIIHIDITSYKFMVVLVLIHIMVASVSYGLVDKKLCGLLNTVYLKIITNERNTRK